MSEKILIGVMTCHARNDRANSQRATWAKDSVLDNRFFYGAGPVHDNSVILGCPDDYANLSLKVIGMCGWALDNGYDRLWKVDDDVYLRPERLIDFTTDDYFGKVVSMLPGDIPTDKSFCMGPIYSLSKKAMEIIINSPLPIGKERQQEDEWVARVLRESGIRPVHTELIRQDSLCKMVPLENWCPRVSNEIISTAEWENSMHIPHDIWLKSLLEKGEFDGLFV